jgi:hypothetical protein
MPTQSIARVRWSQRLAAVPLVAATCSGRRPSNVATCTDSGHCVLTDEVQHRPPLGRRLLDRTDSGQIRTRSRVKPIGKPLSRARCRGRRPWQVATRAALGHSPRRSRVRSRSLPCWIARWRGRSRLRFLFAKRIGAQPQQAPGGGRIPRPSEDQVQHQVPFVCFLSQAFGTVLGHEPNHLDRRRGGEAMERNVSLTILRP